MATREEMILAVKAVQNQFLDQGQVQACMDLQKKLADQGKNVSLVRIFEKKKLLDRHQLHFLATGEGVAIDTSGPEGRKVIEDYVIRDRIGQGGMATVYRATTRELRENVALKILFPHHYKNQRFVEGFLNEAKLLYELEHPNLVRGQDYGQSGGFYYMALEFIDGPSVQEFLDKEGKLSEEMALHVILQVARCLEYLGSKGITHRDIKPDNMLMTAGGQIKLCDLGFAKGGGAGGGEGEQDDFTCGTVQYISPEQARGRSDVDIRSDIYSMGATLYHLVIGEVPFSGSDGMEVMAKQVLEGLSSDKTKTISHHMHYFIEKMMAKEREIRYQSPAELIEDLEGVVEGHQALQFKPESVQKALFPQAEAESERERSGSRVRRQGSTRRVVRGEERTGDAKRSVRRGGSRTSRFRLRRRDRDA